MIYLSGREITPTIFPDGTSQVWKIDGFDDIVNGVTHPVWNVPKSNSKVLRVAFPVEIEWVFENEAEFMHLAQLKMLLDRNGIQVSKLTISYLPYARQDKEVSNNSTFALHTFAQLLNSLNFEKVKVFDPHSSKAGELILHMDARYNKHGVVNAMDKTKSTIVCYPDKGAREKYTDIYKLPSIYGEKQRNQLTGFIEKYEVYGEVVGKNILIVDDICDGGMTFILLTKQLRDKGAIGVHLFVSHGLFSQGIKVLKESGIGKIFTNNGEVK